MTKVAHKDGAEPSNNGSDLKSFIFSELEQFISKEVLKSFGFVLSEAVRRKKIKPNDVRLTPKSPWLKVSPDVDLDLLYGFYEVYSRYKLTDVPGEGGRQVIGEASELYAQKPYALFVEQCIWQALVSTLVYERGIEEQEKRVLSENLNYFLGYLHGIHGMNEYGDKHIVRLMGNESLMSVLARARAVREAPFNRVVEDFFQWARERLAAGDNPTTIKQIEKLPGFKADWAAWPEKKKREKYKAAGFTLKGGRPVEK